MPYIKDRKCSKTGNEPGENSLSDSSTGPAPLLFGRLEFSERSPLASDRVTVHCLSLNGTGNSKFWRDLLYV